jgi:hypothetical protein
MIRFNLEKLKVEDPTNGVVFSAIYQGMSPDKPMMRKLAEDNLDNTRPMFQSYGIFNACQPKGMVFIP